MNNLLEKSNTEHFKIYNKTFRSNINSRHKFKELCKIEMIY